MLACLGAGAEGLVVDAVRADAYARRVEPEPRYGPLAHELARHNDDVRPARGAVVRDPPEEPLATREELREIEMLDVVQGCDARHAESWHGHGKREVHDVDPGEGCAERPRCDRRSQYAQQAAPLPMLSPCTRSRRPSEARRLHPAPARARTPLRRPARSRRGPCTVPVRRSRCRPRRRGRASAWRSRPARVGILVPGLSCPDASGERR